MAARHRGLRRERQRQAAEALPGRPRAGDRRRAGRAHPHGPADRQERAQLGRGLARARAVGQARARRVLDAAPRSEPQGDGLARAHEGHRTLSFHGPGERTEDAHELAREHGGRGADRPRCAHRTVYSLQLPRPGALELRGMEEAARRTEGIVQGRVLLLSPRPVGRTLRLDVRRRPLRPHEHVLRGRRHEGPRERSPALRLQPRQAGRLSTGRGRARPHAGRVSARLRGHAREHQRPRDADAVHRAA